MALGSTAAGAGCEVAAGCGFGVLLVSASQEARHGRNQANQRSTAHLHVELLDGVMLLGELGIANLLLCVNRTATTAATERTADGSGCAQLAVACAVASTETHPF